MKQIHTYLFIISVLICCLCQAQQQQNTKRRANDSLPPAEKYGIRFGIDLARLLRTNLDNQYDGIEILGDFRISHRVYLAAELGNESLERDEENINVKGEGSYIRFGVDYNLYKNWYGMQNNIYAGLRVGMSLFDQTLQSYRIFTSTDYFPNETINEPRKVSDLNSSWAELIVGIKAELFKNIYLSASVALRSIITEQKPEQFDNLFIPGFGRTNDFSSIGVGYSYTLSYLIPFVKRKK